MLLVLIAADILSHTATVNKSTEDKGDGASVVIKTPGYQKKVSARNWEDKVQNIQQRAPTGRRPCGCTLPFIFTYVDYNFELN